MKKNVVVFDIEGIVSYPGFKDQVVRPVRESGKQIKFWSLLWQREGKEELKNVGLGRYATSKRCIGSDSMADLMSNINPLNLQEDSADNIDDILMQMDKLGIPISVPSLQRTIRIGKYWIRHYRTHKYLPILGSDNYLLVESDNARTGVTYPSDVEPIRRSGYQLDEMNTARKEGYSYISVPEHPHVWNEGDQSVRPEMVVTKLRDKLVGWNGEHIVSDLAVELGMYPGMESGSRERK